MNKTLTILLLGILMMVNTSIAQNIDPNNPFKSPKDLKTVQPTKSTVVTSETKTPQGTRLVQTQSVPANSVGRPEMVAKPPMPMLPRKEGQAHLQNKPTSPIIQLTIRGAEVDEVKLPITNTKVASKSVAPLKPIAVPLDPKNSTIEQHADLHKIEIE